MTLDVHHLQGWIGRSDEAEEILTGAMVARFNATFDFALPTGPGMLAPVLSHLCLCQPAIPTAELGADGHPERGGFLPPVALPRRMWAGSDIIFHDDIRVGDRVTRHSVVEDVAVKHGRSGTLCFVTVLHTIASDGRHAITERQNIVYRDVPTGDVTPADALPKAPAELPGADYQKVITPSAPLLFRYSALTFNSHRIHYDAPYTREQEHYPGLVVHGPLQATLMAQFAADLRGPKLATFSFRSTAPIFANADFTLNARADETGMQLWTAGANGTVAMKANATW